ncbi:MAG: Na(+)-translocating NADH-quinone reductase subunit A [Porphyromonas sp.]|nr:Na(+)-translocating NADH-quinone reductase subunit A [Porphyromonas sp.]
MANAIKIKKGLDISLMGKAPEIEVSTARSNTFGIVPDHFEGFQPRLSVQVGDRVLAGSPVLYHKKYPNLVISSPVSGEVVEIKRGAKRKILYVGIRADEQIEYKPFDVSGVQQMDREVLSELLLESGLFALINQRPYDYVAFPGTTPRDIYVTAHFSAPLMPDALKIVEKDKKYLQLAVDALAKLTSGKVYIGKKKGSNLDLTNCEMYELEGPHPVGNVGVLINHTKPINKGETVWTLSIAELALMGRFLATGKVDYSKKIVFAGSRMATAGYSEVLPGSDIRDLVAQKLENNKGSIRVIDGDVLTGRKIDDDYYFLNPKSSIITAIPEGDDVHDILGWALPGFKKYSVSRMFPTFLLGKKKTYDLDARLQGGERPIIVSNEYDKVFPFDIYPEQLIKSIITFDIDKMEQLGIYEVAPEDFALCEFVDTSKLELQYIVRKGLDELYKEMV